MDAQERAMFNDALEICPTWEVANKISYKHINDDLDTPIAIVRAEIGTKNCCARGNVMPITTPICIGCKVMLLDNKVVEGKLQNGSIGEVVDICYKPGETMGKKGAQLYVPCKFSHSCLTKSLMDNGEDASIIPIPVSTKHCEKK